MPTIADKPRAESAERNARAILEVLRLELRRYKKVLEIGSGTGQHAIRFASELRHLVWQTSDLEENHAGIRGWLSEAGLSNVHAPLLLDVMHADVETTFDVVYSSNTAHIMSFEGVCKMFELVARVLEPGGVFVLYGPFRRSARFDTPSNEQFDASLRSRDAAMGIRDLEALDSLAADQGLMRESLYRVPSNNRVIIWKKVKQLSR